MESCHAQTGMFCLRHDRIMTHFYLGVTSMKKNTWKTVLTVVVLLALAAALVVAAVECANGASLANTAWSLLPPVIAIILALITKEAYSALFIGVLVGGLFTCLLYTSPSPRD